MGRKELLTNIPDAPTESNPAEQRRGQATLGLAGRGVVGAMGRSLEQLSAQSEANKALAEKFANGEAVLEVDVSLVDASIVPDRMPGTDAEHDKLVQSISENGQLVPVLLRPHPSQPGRYQTAYGHRRVRALTVLGKPVRAVVRRMTDEELIVAQGKENGERKDLSFIERAIYATTLEDRGFKRETIMSALSVDKGELSRLISVARTIPKPLIDAIGPAPRTGRGRWMELEVAFKAGRPDQDLSDLVESAAFRAKGSDARFLAVKAAVSLRPTKPEIATWSGPNGEAVATIDRKAERTTLAVNEKAAPGFGSFVVDRLGYLYDEFLKESALKN